MRSDSYLIEESLGQHWEGIFPWKITCDEEWGVDRQGGGVDQAPHDCPLALRIALGKGTVERSDLSGLKAQGQPFVSSQP